MSMFKMAIATPKGLGYAIAWVGNGALFSVYGMRAWETSLWRMNLQIAISFFISFVCFSVFLVAMVLVDPARNAPYNKPIDFTALSLLFGSLNCIPLILLVFKQDKTYKRDTNSVFIKMSEAVYDQKDAAGKCVCVCMCVYVRVCVYVYGIVCMYIFMCVY